MYTYSFKLISISNILGSINSTYFEAGTILRAALAKKKKVQKEQVDTKTKLWTDIFSKKAALDKDMVGDLIKKGNEESYQKTSIAISNEGYKKNERRKNIILRGVPESKSTDNAERYDHDVKFLIEQADILRA